MKKILSVLSLIAILGMTTPAMAAPGGPGGPGGHGGSVHGRGHHVSAGHHHRNHHHHVRHVRPHGGITIHAGYPRHGYWSGCRSSYWYGGYCNPRLGWCDPFYAPYGVYAPYNGTSFSIRF